ncbi:hypothetical protein HPB52_003821 [Rhipicephalus sanguineus]|uniref:TIR domain-containing protein n=1 Tax=Rhipicephalus sanguineus TaxID=34632 RepID=A0A9D4T0Z5_RHISA|nr:hypothetical protein HPB52_003821 [Rhipicephalus sanguineus]
MREAPFVPAWFWLWLLAWGPCSRAWKRDEMPSHSRVRTLDSLYISPQFAVALTVGRGKLLAAWFRNNCGLQHTSDGGLVITGHQCYDVPTVDMSSWAVPASGIAMYLTPHVLPSLEILNLGGTQIWRIEEYDLVPMENSSLKHLQINLCDMLTFMHPHALKPLKHLEGFYFRDNLNMPLDNIIDVITNITQETFRVIDVSQPVSKTATYTILQAVSRTTAEIVIFIRLTDATLTKDFFPLMPRVKCIVLESGKIRDFKPKAVANLPNLEEISFVRNQFLGIPSGILEPRLKVLDLSGYDRGFIQLDVPDYVFGKMSNLRELYLRYKALPSLTEYTFWGLYFNRDALRSFDRLHILDLSENVFSCTCGIRPFLEWLRGTNVTVRYLPYTTLYTCGDPLEMDGKAILTVDSLLQRTCKPTLLVSIVCVGIVILVIISLLVAGYIYRRRFDRWLRSQSTARSAASKVYLYDAFVSYSNSDTQWVISRLLPQLECSTIGNLKLCVYDRDFVAGRNISECILESIKQSRKIILVLSNSFLQSPWCKFETDLAQYTLLEENRDAFILLKISRLDETLLSPKLNYLLKTRIHLSWSQSPKEEVVFFNKLHKALTDDRTRPLCEQSAPAAAPKLLFFKKVKRKANLV